MKNDLTTGAWQHDIGCPIKIVLFSISDGGSPTTTPSKVYTAFAEQNGLTFEQMEDEMDWLCWPTTLME
jgi:hypothetical protein